MFVERSRLSRLGPTEWLAASVVGVYLLVVVGATASFAEAAQACSTWPVCTGALDDPTVLIALGHRALAAVVGLVLLAAGVAVFRSGTTRRTKLTTALALVLYPVQIAVGALLATSVGAGLYPGVHLSTGVSIFGVLLLALAWHLEHETGTDDAGIPPEQLTPGGPVEADADGTASLPDGGTSEQTFGSQLRTRAFAYFRLTKPRLMWLLSLVAAAAMALAAGSTGSISVGTIVFTLGGGVLAIGASGTFNNVLERDRDRWMSRTDDRPVVTHQVPGRNAVVFGLVLTGLSILAFLQVNALVAALGFVAILFYTIGYTLVLKPNTVQNTVLGGAAGSLPALIGWAAVTGRIGVAGLVLAGLIFVWTPAHFYNLALAYRDDYVRGGFPMMPVVRGETTTRKHILLWLGATLAFASSLIWLTPVGWLAATTTIVLGGVFLWAVVRLHHERTEEAAFRAFHASNAYLGLFLIAIVVDAMAL